MPLIELPMPHASEARQQARRARDTGRADYAALGYVAAAPRDIAARPRQAHLKPH